MFNLGLLYDEGHGVAQDYAKAREWYEKAADKGDTTAMKNLGWLYANAQGVARDYAKTREWWERRGEIGSRYCGGVPRTGLQKFAVIESGLGHRSHFFHVGRR
jgi:TPR repeat protein